MGVRLKPTPAERALGANIAQGLDVPQRANVHAELVYGMRMASHPAGSTALTLRNEGYEPADGWSQGIDATTPFGTQHVEAVMDSLRAARQAGGARQGAYSALMVAAGARRNRLRHRWRTPGAPGRQAGRPGQVCGIAAVSIHARQFRCAITPTNFA